MTSDPERPTKGAHKPHKGLCDTCGVRIKPGNRFVRVGGTCPRCGGTIKPGNTPGPEDR